MCSITYLYSQYSHCIVVKCKPNSILKFEYTIVVRRVNINDQDNNLELNLNKMEELAVYIRKQWVNTTLTFSIELL